MTLTPRLDIARVTFTLAVLVGLAIGPAIPASAATPLQVDQTRVDELVALVGADRATFGGVSIEHATGVLTIRYAIGAGLHTAKGKLSKLTGAHKSGAKRNKLVFVPVQHSLAGLDAVRDRVRSDKSWNTVASKVISRTYVDVTNNVVAVGLTMMSPEVVAAARNTFGDQVSLHVAARPDETSRTSDFAPWKSGIRINGSNGLMCTSGFVIRKPSTNEKRMITAGHCGELGTVWRNNGNYVGTMIGRAYTQGGFDLGHLGGSTYQPWGYVGGPTSNAGQSYTGTYLSVVGRKFCTNGATSGEVCTGTVTAIDACVTFTSGKNTCFLDVLTSDGSFTMSRGGDSGGPLIQPADVNTDSLQIGGIIIGVNGRLTYFHSFHYLVPSDWVVDTQ